MPTDSCRALVNMYKCVMFTESQLLLKCNSESLCNRTVPFLQVESLTLSRKKENFLVELFRYCKSPDMRAK